MKEMEDWIRKGFEEADESEKKAELVERAFEELKEGLLEYAAEPYPGELLNRFGFAIISSGGIELFNRILQTFFAAGFLLCKHKDDIKDE